MSKYIVARFRFRNGYASSLPITEGNGYLRQGSLNAMVSGSGLISPFKGLGADLGVDGSDLYFLTDNSYAGLGEADLPGFGSVFQAIDLLFFIGSGPLTVRGVRIQDVGPVDVDADSNLSYLTRNGSVFDDGTSDVHYFQVGHARPSAPSVFSKSPPSAGKNPMSAAVSVVIWRGDSMTGQPSLPSEPSTVVELTSGSLIVQFPAADDNGQDVWGIGVPLLGLRDLGNFYQLPVDIGGEVLESTLSYTRTVTGCSISSAGTTVTTTDPDTADQFTSEDIGRRIAFGGFDSYITQINSATSVEVADTAGANYSADATVTHAVDGILRAVEISWADTDLFGQPLAPYEAFTPPDGFFAGVMRDVFYIEDTFGTIFYSIPNYLSFPRSRRIFTEERAVCWITTGNGYHWRISNQTVSKLYYVGGLQPLMLDVKSSSVGCQYPQNAAVGYAGRLMLWAGRPTLVDSEGNLNSTFYLSVERDFDGWEDQTSEERVITGYDPIGQYEVWIKGNTAMAMHAPTGRWCSPIALSAVLALDSKVLSTVIINERLHLVIELPSKQIEIREWNAGSGSVMTLQSYHEDPERSLATITEVETVVQAGDTVTTYTPTVIKDFVTEVPLTGVSAAVSPADQVLDRWKPNIRGCQTVGVKFVVTGPAAGPASGRAAVDYITLYGEISQVSAQRGTNN